MIPQGVLEAVGALAGGYAVGCIPVAWLLVRREEHRRGGVERIDPASPFARRGPSGAPALRRTGTRSDPGTLGVLAAGGIRFAALMVVLELCKGAVVGVGARLFLDADWFTTLAIAGCVAGDTFPVGIRRGRRGVVPLVSGVWAALPGVWAAGFLIAIPALLLVVLSGAAFEAVVVLSVPLAFLLGTRDAGTLPAAAIIVAAIVGQSRLRRQARQGAITEAHVERR